MVSTKGDDSRQGLSVQCRAFPLRIGGRRSSKDCVMAFFNLMQCPSVIVSATPGLGQPDKFH